MRGQSDNQVTLKSDRKNKDKMLKIGSQVETVRACGALAAEGSVDLSAGTAGTLLGVRGDHAKVELTAAGTAPTRVVYLATAYLGQHD